MLLISSCSVNKKPTGNEKNKQYYDSLADQLFLLNVDLKATSNRDSVKIDFLTNEDFELIIGVRKLCQVISDSVGLRFKIKNFSIKDFGELEIEKQIIEYDTSLFPLVAKYLKQTDKKTFDSLKQKIGLSPATIIDFHDKVDRYLRIIKQDNSYKDGKKHLIITYYVSELTEVPYPKTLYRLFVNDKNEVIDSGLHEDYEKEIDYQEDEVNEATTNNRVARPAIGSLCESKLLFLVCPPICRKSS
jgi:hypothetical protein